MSSQVLIFASLSITVVLVFLAFGDVVLGRNRMKKKRLRALRQRMGTELPDIAPHASVLLEDKSANPGLDKILKRFLPSSQVLGQRLARAGVNCGPGVFLATMAGVAVLSGFVLMFALGLNAFLSVLGAIGIGVGGTHGVLEFLMSKRNTAFTKGFPEAIDLIVRTVKSGLPVTEGITVVGHEMNGPVSQEFRRISEGMRIGETLEQALWAASHRLDNAEFNFFVISLVVQSETGGNLAETLENLSDILRQRQQMKLKIKAMASEARASAYILGCLPFLMVGILEIMSPGYTAPLFNHDTGAMMTGMALISIAIGVFIMFKMVRFEI